MGGNFIAHILNFCDEVDSQMLDAWEHVQEHDLQLRAEGYHVVRVDALQMLQWFDFVANAHIVARSNARQVNVVAGVTIEIALGNSQSEPQHCKAMRRECQTTNGHDRAAALASGFKFFLKLNILHFVLSCQPRSKVTHQNHGEQPECSRDS